MKLNHRVLKARHIRRMYDKLQREITLLERVNDDLIDCEPCRDDPDEYRTSWCSYHDWVSSMIYGYLEACEALSLDPKDLS